MSEATTMFLGVLILAVYGGAVANLLQDAVKDKNYWAWFQLFFGVFLTFNAMGPVSIFSATPVTFYGPLDKLLSGMVVGGGFNFASSLIMKLYGMITGKPDTTTITPTLAATGEAGTEPVPTPLPKWYMSLWARVLITALAFILLTLAVQLLQGTGVNTGFGPL